LIFPNRIENPMKQCSYCGTEYPEGTAFCAIDHQPLDPPALETRPEAVASAPPPVPYNPDAIYPEYRWTARDGWKFIGMMIVFDVLWYVVMRGLRLQLPSVYELMWGGPFFLFRRFVFVSIPLVTAAYFARTESFESFWIATGLNRKPTEYVWFGVVAALAVRWVGHILLALHLARGSPDPYMSMFHRTVGFGRFVYLVPMLMAAFVEEPANRGFLYKAFRSSIPVPISMIFVVMYTAYRHWAQYSYLGVAVITLSAITVAQCYLREKSGSLWDCIICHFVFNASSLIVGYLPW
jgi:membrane protease YdiL (CAAX protease family)